MTSVSSASQATPISSQRSRPEKLYDVVPPPHPTISKIVYSELPSKAVKSSVTATLLASALANAQFDNRLLLGDSVAPFFRRSWTREQAEALLITMRPLRALVLRMPSTASATASVTPAGRPGAIAALSVSYTDKSLVIHHDLLFAFDAKDGSIEWTFGKVGDRNYTSVIKALVEHGMLQLS